MPPNRKSPVQFWKIGSDPEFLFARHHDTNVLSVIPATKLVGTSPRGMQSLIGRDGHSITGELRPPPSHNVRWHLAHIAYALTQIEGRLRSLENVDQYSGKDVVLVAQPVIAGEPLGGHIWVSFYYHSPTVRKMFHTVGSIMSSPGGRLVETMQQDPQLKKPSSRARLNYIINRYERDVQQGLAPTLSQAWLKLHFLLEPLEIAVFGPMHHIREDMVRSPFVRLPNTECTQIPLRKNAGYLLFEYRYPSSWLCDPALAYAYLGLAKLAMLNWTLIPDYHREPLYDPRRQLLERLARLTTHPDYRQTPDLSALLPTVHKQLETPRVSPLLINFEAWRRVLPPSGEAAV